MLKYENVALPSELISDWHIKGVTRRTQMLSLAVYAKYRALVSQKCSLSNLPLMTLAKITGTSPAGLKRYHYILQRKKLILVDRRSKGVTIHLLEDRKEKFFTVPIPILLSTLSLTHVATLIIMHWYGIVKNTPKVQISLIALSKRLGMTSRAISKILRNTESLGFIKILPCRVNEPGIFQLLNTNDIVIAQNRHNGELKIDITESSESTYIGRVPKEDYNQLESYTTYKIEGGKRFHLELDKMPDEWRKTMNEEDKGFDFMSNYESEKKVEITERKQEVEAEVKKGEVHDWGVIQFLGLFRMLYEWKYQEHWSGMTSAKDRAIMTRLIAFRPEEETREDHAGRLRTLADRIKFMFEHWEKLNKVLKLYSKVPNVSILHHYGDSFAAYRQEGFPEVDGDRDYNLKHKLGTGKSSLKKDLTEKEESSKLDPGLNEMDKFLNN